MSQNPWKVIEDVARRPPALDNKRKWFSAKELATFIRKQKDKRKEQ